MTTSTHRSSTRPTVAPSTLVARVGELSNRVDSLVRQVENLTELVKGQNELLHRQYRLEMNGSAEAPAARLASEFDPAGPADRDGYPDLVIRIRALVRSIVPFGAKVLVASKGDEELLLLEGRRGWHFPQADDGVYRGHHPVDSEDAINGLENLRLRGAEFFVLPSTAFWWLDHYAAFAIHLNERYKVALRNQEACLIFDLRSGNGEVTDA